ncbi:MAG: LysM peptidoglycan-binding domain-containing protein [Phycisphaerales bacterium]|nr:LysM peptidoglycan-binding domain-containing protein [Phycisphaerales bacterium]
MTREHKLAVVLGFGLLLFVGILVSDHFSATQRRNPADLVANTQMRVVRPQGPVSIQPVQVTNRTALAQHTSQTPGGDGLALPLGVVAQPAPAALPTGVPAELYTLKDGETLYKICQSRYGNGNLWQKLAEFNKGTISNPTKLRKGTTIRLPSASVLRGDQPTAVVAPALPQPAQSGGGAALPQATPTQREYVVQKGDTLGTIAAHELGSAKKWELIFDANRDRLKNPAALKVGTGLRIPSDAQ